MSFGFGIGDIINCSKLAISAYNALKDAPSELEGLRLEVLSLNATLRALAEEANSPTSIILVTTPQRRESLRVLLENCSRGLSQLEVMVSKARNLGVGEKNRFFEHVKFAMRDKRGPRDKLAIHTASINIFLTSLTHSSLGRLELLVKNALRETASGHTQNMAAFATGQTAKMTMNVAGTDKSIGFGGQGQTVWPPPRPKSNPWNEISAELALEGIESSRIEPLRDEIVTYVRHLVHGGDPFWLKAPRGTRTDDLRLGSRNPSSRTPSTGPPPKYEVAENKTQAEEITLYGSYSMVKPEPQGTKLAMKPRPQRTTPPQDQPDGPPRQSLPSCARPQAPPAAQRSDEDGSRRRNDQAPPPAVPKMARPLASPQMTPGTASGGAWFGSGTAFGSSQSAPQPLAGGFQGTQPAQGSAPPQPITGGRSGQHAGSNTQASPYDAGLAGKSGESHKIAIKDENDSEEDYQHVFDNEGMSNEVDELVDMFDHIFDLNDDIPNAIGLQEPASIPLGGPPELPVQNQEPLPSQPLGAADGIHAYHFSLHAGKLRGVRNTLESTMREFRRAQEQKMVNTIYRIRHDVLPGLIKTLRDSGLVVIQCDGCQGVVIDSHYHCEICNDGDFDLCESCYKMGRRCPLSRLGHQNSHRSALQWAGEQHWTEI